MADAVVVGAGPNGLAAAITLARAGRSVLVLEAEETIGGGCRSEELTLPGVIHDVCSAIHPLAAASPFFRSLPLGLTWVHPDAPVAHPLDDGTAVLLERDLDAGAANLGGDGAAYRRLFGPLVDDGEALLADLLAGPLKAARRPVAAARFGLAALRSARSVAEGAFEGPRARALFGGLAAHSVLPLERAPSAAVAMVMGASAHAAGWPMAEGGSQRIADALAAELRGLGGEVRTGHRVRSMSDVPAASMVLMDVGPAQLLRIAGDRLPDRERRKLARFRYGPGVFKLDWALDGPIPWKAESCLRAGTVHLGGTLEELSASEAAAWRGDHAERPFVLLAQQSLFDGTRAPEGIHTAWAYCHVPNGSTLDMTERIEDQVERFAPGFRDRIVRRHALDTAGFERHDENLVGGDINGGRQDLGRLLGGFSPGAYATGIEGVYLCSASTPPGGGVHGMCGHLAARSALHRSGSGHTG